MEEQERCNYCNRVVNFTDVSECGPRVDEQPCTCCGLIIVAEQETPVVEEEDNE
jgi:hypothetical protein